MKYCRTISQQGERRWYGVDLLSYEDKQFLTIISARNLTDKWKSICKLADLANYAEVPEEMFEDFLILYNSVLGQCTSGEIIAGFNCDSYLFDEEMDECKNESDNDDKMAEPDEEKINEDDLQSRMETIQKLSEKLHFPQQEIEHYFTVIK